MLKTKCQYIWVAALMLMFSAMLYSCHKTDLIDTSPSAKLTFSTNIVKFDTVFSTVNSATHNFTAKNPNKQSVILSHIMLQGGANSYFRININGRGTTDFPNIEIAAGDSIYIFAEVTPPGSAANMPFILTDTILFVLNGHTQKVALQAFGRNAHFINDQYVPCNADWINDGIPYVIYQATEVKAGCTLTIEKGVTVYCHASTVFLVYGTLITNGTKDEPVIFRQDRLEHTYDNSPGQWWGIRFVDSSTNNVLTHTIVEEATRGIEVDSFPLSGNPFKLIMNKCIIKNCSETGLYGFTGTINATNSLIYSSNINLDCSLGGTYVFSNCTFDNSYNAATNPLQSIQIDNYPYTGSNNITHPFDLAATFEDCIIYGALDDEVKLSDYTTSKFNLIFDHNIIKAKMVTFPPTNIINANPSFKNAFGGDYHLDTLSPAIDMGAVLNPPVLDDLDDVVRDAKPDIGCYEFKK